MNRNSNLCSKILLISMLFNMNIYKCSSMDRMPPSTKEIYSSKFNNSSSQFMLNSYCFCLMFAIINNWLHNKKATNSNYIINHSLCFQYYFFTNNLDQYNKKIYQNALDKYIFKIFEGNTHFHKSLVCIITDIYNKMLNQKYYNDQNFKMKKFKTISYNVICEFLDMFKNFITEYFDYINNDNFMLPFSFEHKWERMGSQEFKSFIQNLNNNKSFYESINNTIKNTIKNIIIYIHSQPSAFACVDPKIEYLQSGKLKITLQR